VPKMVIEVPEKFTEVGKAMAEHLAALQRTVSRLGGGKAVDYAEIEQAMAESAGSTELAGHRAILQSLDIMIPEKVATSSPRFKSNSRIASPGSTRADSACVSRGRARVPSPQFVDGAGFTWVVAGSLNPAAGQGRVWRLSTAPHPGRRSARRTAKNARVTRTCGPAGRRLLDGPMRESCGRQKKRLKLPALAR